MRAKKIAKKTAMPKSQRYCPNCDDITVFGFNIKLGHSCCSICGKDSNKAKFIRWCNPAQVDPPWKYRKSQMSKRLIEEVLKRVAKRKEQNASQYRQDIAAFDDI